MTHVAGAPVVTDPAEDGVHEGRALLDLLGTRLGRLRAATAETATILRLLIAERAQAELTCTASFVDVSELT